jgi:crotonobetainyl-CoA:carnitine CoA-transferase CaiB-like acyl-CoA transferase
MSGLGLATPRDRLSTEGQRPLKAGGNQALMIAGLSAATGTMHALFAREGSGQGSLVDVSEVEPLASFQFLNVARWTYAGDTGDRGYGEGSRRFWCADGAVSMLLFTGQQRQWEAFRELIDNPKWLDEGNYQPPLSRIKQDDPFWARVNEWAGRHTKEEVYRKAQGLRVPLFPENDVASRRAGSRAAYAGCRWQRRAVPHQLPRTRCTARRRRCAARRPPWGDTVDLPAAGNLG